jgi:hypothetical protein
MKEVIDIGPEDFLSRRTIWKRLADITAELTGVFPLWEKYPSQFQSVRMQIVSQTTSKQAQ